MIFPVVCFVVGLAIVHHPADMFHVELVRASARTLIFMIVHAIVFSDHVHDRMNDLFGRSRVRTPGLANDLFCRSRVRFPDLIVCFRPIVSVAYVTRPHD